VRGIEHVLAADELVARVPAGADRRGVEEEIDAAGAPRAVEHDRAPDPLELAALLQEAEMRNGEACMVRLPSTRYVARLQQPWLRPPTRRARRE
jgi:hypothetical protein